MAQIPVTTYPERREECVEHEKRMDQVDKDLHYLSGMIKGMGVIIGALVVVLGWVGNSIVVKLDLISTQLTTMQIADAGRDGRIRSLEDDVKEIKDRHKNLDQNGVIKKIR